MLVILLEMGDMEGNGQEEVRGCDVFFSPSGSLMDVERDKQTRAILNEFCNILSISSGPCGGTSEKNTYFIQPLATMSRSSEGGWPNLDF